MSKLQKEKILSCQICSSRNIKKVLSLGFFPIANELQKISNSTNPQINYPLELFFCKRCYLVQLGYIIPPKKVFTKNFPYTSSTNKSLSINFKNLFNECKKIINIYKSDYVLDIGSNDGNLLSFFKNHCNVLGVTPENIGKIAIKKNIPTYIDFFNNSIVKKVKNKYGLMKIITCTNTFAHIPNINEVLNNIKKLLKNDGVFISESHYLQKLISNLQYDTIYHEHLRYYSVHSLKYLFDKHKLEIFKVKKIPTHGGSIRVYAARKGKYKVEDNVKKILKSEKDKVISYNKLFDFSKKIIKNKLELLSLIKKIKINNNKIFAIGAAARASTLINYIGLNGIIENVMEVSGSYKIGYFMSGTKIPIVNESIIFKEKPEYILILSWHISEYLIKEYKKKGYKGKFIIPLPKAKIVN